jgi:hypothetical protein
MSRVSSSRREGPTTSSWNFSLGSRSMGGGSSRSSRTACVLRHWIRMRGMRGRRSAQRGQGGQVAARDGLHVHLDDVAAVKGVVGALQQRSDVQALTPAYARQGMLRRVLRAM